MDATRWVVRDPPRLHAGVVDCGVECSHRANRSLGVHLKLNGVGRSKLGLGILEKAGVDGGGAGVRDEVDGGTDVNWTVASSLLRSSDTSSASFSRRISCSAAVAE